MGAEIEKVEHEYNFNVNCAFWDNGMCKAIWLNRDGNYVYTMCEITEGKKQICTPIPRPETLTWAK